jgi:hypothetical protein
LLTEPGRIDEALLLRFFITFSSTKTDTLGAVGSIVLGKKRKEIKASIRGLMIGAKTRKSSELLSFLDTSNRLNGKPRRKQCKGELQDLSISPSG